MGDLQAWLAMPNGGMDEYGIPPQAQNPEPSAIGAESWRRGEEATEEVIWRIQPTIESEQKRRAVMEHVQRLLKGHLHIEVLPFGSVPLKTYLPDGDIDLTALGLLHSEDSLASDVRLALETEEQNADAELEIKDVQYIHAEVKLVKCLVQDIIVDISFNQIGGLCTLCFLEKVDSVIGKSNLFKRSIILIKAWCYYESRILGAHHGLISTYALETLVLYIFHLFHSSLCGPLAVLYRFLDYYSKFDWDNYCISLYGPIPLSSLPELAAEVPENDGGELLITKDFLRKHAEMFSDTPRGFENISRSFPQKHLNIVDPLKENNNLGRSVSKGNFYRIRSAFTFGARNLGRILSLPPESMKDEIKLFFVKALDRHGTGERLHLEAGLVPWSETRGIYQNENGTVASESEVESREEGSILEKPATDLPNSGTSASPSNSNISPSPSGKAHSENGCVNGFPQRGSAPNEENEELIRMDSYETESSTSSASWPSNHRISPPGSSIDGNEEISANGSPTLSQLADLSGDCDMHYKSLQYAHGWCREQFMGRVFHPIHRASSPRYPHKYSWDTAVPQHAIYLAYNANGIVPRPPFPPQSPFPIPPPMPGAYNMENMPRSRGTGTYIPNGNYRANKERQSYGRGRNTAPGIQMPRPRNNVRAEIALDTNFSERGSQDPPSNHTQVPISSVNERWKPPQLDIHKQLRATSSKTYPHANGFLSPSNGKVEFGSFAAVSLGASPSLPEVGKKLDSDSSHSLGSGQAVRSLGSDRPRQPYQLKNDDDFPPLT